jgi:hypothetical protein
MSDGPVVPLSCVAKAGFETRRPSAETGAVEQVDVSLSPKLVRVDEQMFSRAQRED